MKRFSDFVPFSIPQESNFSFGSESECFKSIGATDDGRKTEELRNRDCVVPIFARFVFLSASPPITLKAFLTDSA